MNTTAQSIVIEGTLRSEVVAVQDTCCMEEDLPLTKCFMYTFQPTF